MGSFRISRELRVRESERGPICKRRARGFKKGECRSNEEEMQGRGAQARVTEAEAEREERRENWNASLHKATKSSLRVIATRV